MFVALFVVKLFAILVLADDLNESLPSGQTRRILYGDSARIEDYPYFASLWNCGAAILSDRWVATAAHCVNSAEARGPQYVFVGGNTIQESTRFTYNEFVIHPEYGTFHEIQVNDIALLKLTAPLKFSEKVQPAKLPYGYPPRDAVIVAMGWDETGRPTVDLKKADLILLSPEECLEMLPRNYIPFALQNMKYLEKVTLCSKRRGPITPSVCRVSTVLTIGDSGSPILSGNILIGVHSYGNKHCNQGKLGFNTNVLNFVPWIRANTGI